MTDELPVWRRVRVKDLPARPPLHDMEFHMTKNWEQAVPVAVEALGANDICDEVPLDVASAAMSLLCDPIWLGRDDDDGYFYVNGGHRSEAMSRQGVEEVIVIETRLIDEARLPGEIREVRPSDRRVGDDYFYRDTCNRWRRRG